MEIDKVTAAKLKLVKMHPFWSVFALRQSVEIREDIKGDLATDGKTLAIHPNWLNRAPMEEVVAGIAEAATHVANGHHTRRGGRDQQLWDKASHEAALHILDGEFPYWQGKANQDYSGLATEDIYAKLKQEQQKNQQQHQPNSQNGNQDGKDKGSGNAPGKGPQVALQAPADPQQEDNERKQMLRIAARAEAGRKAGNVPIALQQLIKNTERPPVDWREELTALATAPAKNDYQWHRPNRRYIHQGLYLPSLGGVQLAPLILAIDVSGSTGPFIAPFLAAADDIIDQFPGIRVHIITCNTQVQEQETVEEAPIRKKWKTGGGTRFAPVFDAVKDWTDPETGMEPAGMAFLTDLKSPDLDQCEEPPFPVLWAVFGRNGRTGKVPFGRIIPVPLEDAANE